MSNCAHCNAPLAPEKIKAGRKYCSRPCLLTAQSIEYEANAPRLNCPTCHTPFLTRDRTKYCSRACAQMARRTMRAPGNCAICGKQLTGQQRVTCSHVCSGVLNSGRSVHSEEMREQFRALWAQEEPRLSVKEIGNLLGVTNNVIVGLRKRMNLPTRGNPVKRTGAPKQPRPPRIRNTSRSTGPHRPPRSGIPFQVLGALGRRPPKPAPAPAPAATIVYMPFRTCQYPLNDKREWIFCDAPVVAGRPYCACHTAMCYRPTGEIAA